jgi:hypothetical protein
VPPLADIAQFTPNLDRLIEFSYTNWRGREHVYVVEPEGVALGSYDASGQRERSADDTLDFVLHGMVVTRADADGNNVDTRPDMGSNRRRTFRVDGMRGIRVLERSK